MELSGDVLFLIAEQLCCADLRSVALTSKRTLLLFRTLSPALALKLSGCERFALHGRLSALIERKFAEWQAWCSIIDDVVNRYAPKPKQMRRGKLRGRNPSLVKDQAVERMAQSAELARTVEHFVAEMDRRFLLEELMKLDAQLLWRLASTHLQKLMDAYPTARDRALMLSHELTKAVVSIDVLFGAEAQNVIRRYGLWQRSACDRRGARLSFKRALSEMDKRWMELIEIVNACQAPQALMNEAFRIADAIDRNDDSDEEIDDGRRVDELWHYKTDEKLCKRMIEAVDADEDARWTLYVFRRGGKMKVIAEDVMQLKDPALREKFENASDDQLQFLLEELDVQLKLERRCGHEEPSESESGEDDHSLTSPPYVPSDGEDDLEVCSVD